MRIIINWLINFYYLRVFFVRIFLFAYIDNSLNIYMVIIVSCIAFVNIINFHWHWDIISSYHNYVSSVFYAFNKLFFGKLKINIRSFIQRSYLSNSIFRCFPKLFQNKTMTCASISIILIFNNCVYVDNFTGKNNISLCLNYFFN